MDFSRTNASTEGGGVLHDDGIDQPTGFLFPFRAMTPAIKLGIISLAALAITTVTRYPLHLAWRKTYVITACERGSIATGLAS